MRKLIALAIAASLSLPLIAATPHRVPGLWQVTTSMRFTQGGIQIPPEVREQMAASGMKIPDFSKPHTFKHCVTAEEAASDDQPGFTNDESCKTTSSKWTGGQFHAEFTCSGRAGPTTSVVDGTMTAGGKAYAGTFRSEGNNPEMGGHFVMQGQASGKWVGPNCGTTTAQ